MPSLPQVGLSFSQTERRQGWSWPNKKSRALLEPTGALWGLLPLNGRCRLMLIAITTPSLTTPNWLGLKEHTQDHCQHLRNLPALDVSQSDPERVRVEAPPSPLAADPRSHFPGTQGRGLHLPRPCSFLEGDSKSPPGTPSSSILRLKTRTQASAEVITQSMGQDVDRESRRSRSVCIYLLVCV